MIWFHVQAPKDLMYGFAGEDWWFLGHYSFGLYSSFILLTGQDLAAIMELLQAELNPETLYVITDSVE